MSSALEKDQKLQSELKKEQEALKEDEKTVQEVPDEPARKPDGRLVVEEETVVGRVTWSARTHLESTPLSNTVLTYFLVRLFFSNMSGSAGSFWTYFVVAFVASKLFDQLDFWVLGLWARQYETHDPSDVLAP